MISVTGAEYLASLPQTLLAVKTKVVEASGMIPSMMVITTTETTAKILAMLLYTVKFQETLL
jgi:hypothetical protein